MCVRYRPSDYRGLINEYLEIAGRVGEKHANASHHIVQTTTQSPYSPIFLLLSFSGVLGLWVVAYFDGMTDRMETILRTLRMPDGRHLRSTYTGIRLVDWQLTLLSSFYEVLSNNLTYGPRLLFFDLNFVVACTNLWVLMESRRREVARAWYLRWPVWAIILWNANGAAIVQPIFFWLAHTTYQANHPYNSEMPLNDAIALFAVTLPIMAAPLLLFTPAWLGLTTWQHHGYIALFQASPLLVTAAFIALSIVLKPATTTTTTTSTTSKGSSSKKWIFASLLSAGTIAAAVHLFTIFTTLRSADPDASAARLFIPDLVRAGIRGFATVTLPAAHEYEALIENLHLFSQFDWWVVAASCVSLSHLLLKEGDGPYRDLTVTPTTRTQWKELAYLVVGSLVFGPGAAGTFALAVREIRL
ncbi:hypothetical protein N656DRAFT_708267 [Canariomyces notabilis]|uniref:Uncharacterized protein n=1 Tax=Canariomyces notabilis TaxID=2074819 RepID=A0AAN6TG90_9PEZI|nr:hypothetical protein N656DRAFT_708267 [Canariomyces arenarius]